MLGDLKIGVSADLGLATLELGIRETFEALMSTLSRSFAKVDNIKPDLSSAPEVFKTIRVMDVYARASELDGGVRDQLGDNVRNNFALAETLTFAETARSSAAHTVIFKEFQKLFDTHDVLICPTTAVSPFPADHPFPSEINGDLVADYTAVSYTHLTLPTILLV